MDLEKKVVSLLLFFVILLTFGVVHSAIYTYVDEHGVIHFTNVKPINRKYEVLIPERKSFSSQGKIRKSENDYEEIIRYYAKKYNVDPLLVKAVIIAESNFNPHAVSRRGAVGLMQIMPETAKMLNLKNLFDPEENIKGGTLYLKILKEHFNDNLDLVLAAYNAGPKRVIESKMNFPAIEETINYVKRVKDIYFRLKLLNK